MKRKKLSTKILSLALLVAMLFTTMPTAAFATEDDSVADNPSNRLVTAASTNSGTDGSCSWEITDGVLTISPTNGTEGTLSPSLTYLWQEETFTSIVVSPGVKTGSSAESLFRNLAQCTAMDLANLDTSATNNMFAMFYGCANLESITFGEKFTTTIVTTMASMFSGCRGLGELDLSNFDTANVTDMTSMFYGCNALTTLNLSNFDTTDVTTMASMFSNCSTLTELDLSNFDTANVTDMTQMFNGCSALTTLDLKSFDTSDVTTMVSMFYGCSDLTALDLNNFDTANVKYMSSMFDGCRILTALDLSKFNTANVTDMDSMFLNCRGLSELKLSSKFNTANVTAMQSMFSGCNALTTLDLSSFDTTNVIYMSFMFNGCSTLTTLDVSKFNTANVTAMQSMFAGCSDLIALDLSNFTFSGNLDKMLESCSPGLKTDYYYQKMKSDSSPLYLYNKSSKDDFATGQTDLNGMESNIFYKPYTVNVEGAENNSISVSAMVDKDAQNYLEKTAPFYSDDVPQYNPDASYSQAGKTVTLAPQSGYILDTIGVKDSHNNDITVSESEGNYTFTMPKADVTVEVTFKENMVLFDARGGTKVSPVTIGSDGTLVLPANPAWTTGYTFAGWYTEKDGKGTSIGSYGDTYSSAKAGTLYAKWTKDGKTVITQPLDFSTATGDLSGDGYRWNNTSKTLTLYGANIINCEPPVNVSGKCLSYGIMLPATAAIALTANTTSTILAGNIGAQNYDNAGEASSCGICVPIDATAGTLTIIGSGTLNVNGGVVDLSGIVTKSSSIGIDANDITVEKGATVSAMGAYSAGNSVAVSCGVLATLLTINNGTLTGTGGTQDGTSAGVSLNSLTMNGGILNGFAGTVPAGNGSSSEGVSAQGGMTITDGYMTAKGGTCAVVASADNPIIASGATVSGANEIFSSGKTAVLTQKDPAIPVVLKFTPTSGGGTSTPPSENNNVTDDDQKNTSVIIDGKLEIKDDTTTVTVSDKNFSDKVDAAQDGGTVIIPVNTNTNTVVAQMVVKNVEEMAAKNMTLTVQSGNISYHLPTAAVNTGTMLEQLGATDPSKVPFAVTITNEKNAKVEGATLVVAPVSFEVSATYNGKTVTVDRFDNMVARTLEITKEQAQKITTAVVVENGEIIRHVPTYVYQQSEKYYAKISSMTNSTYAIIVNESAFVDTAGKWYEAVADELSARKITKDIWTTEFDGEKTITRAEFVALLVNAFGLPRSEKADYSDVPADAWYATFVATASKYGIVSGIGNHRFAPNATITREQAMVMIARAAKVVKHEGDSTTIGSFHDYAETALWAKDGVDFNLKNGLIVGKSNNTLDLKSPITRGETATVIIRLLQNAELVDIRAKV